MRLEVKNLKRDTTQTQFMKNPEEVNINGTVYVPKSEAMAKSPEGLPCVIIRSYAAGVHFGYLAKEEFTLAGKVVTLVHTRRVFYWSGAASLSQMAIDGIGNAKDSKVSMILASNEIVNAIETIPVTEKAKENLYNQPIWKV
jgi:hypothetical protein